MIIGKYFSIQFSGQLARLLKLEFVYGVFSINLRLLKFDSRRNIFFVILTISEHRFDDKCGLFLLKYGNAVLSKAVRCEVAD